MTIKHAWAAMALGVMLLSMPGASHGQDICQRIDALNEAIQRCQQRIANNEIDECDIAVPWQQRTVSLGEAQGIAGGFGCDGCICEYRRQIRICNSFYPPASQVVAHRNCLADRRGQYDSCRAVYCQ
jgi:hypothetical protein